MLHPRNITFLLRTARCCSPFVDSARNCYPPLHTFLRLSHRADSTRSSFFLQLIGFGAVVCFSFVVAGMVRFVVTVFVTTVPRWPLALCQRRTTTPTAAMAKHGMHGIKEDQEINCKSTNYQLPKVSSVRCTTPN